MKERIVYTAGTFDLFHVGHVNLLRACRAIAGPDGEVVVALNTDDFVREYKGEHPIMNYREREALVLGCRYVDKVISNVGGADSRPAIKFALHLTGDRPKTVTAFIVIGSDWATKDYYKQMGFTQSWLDQHEITLCYVPYTTGISTTKLRRHLCD